MQTYYMARLSPLVQQLAKHVEDKSGISIDVCLDPKLNERGPLGQGMLSVDIESSRVTINTPTNEYFPDEAVFHELLHVRRFHVDGLPRLTLAEDEARNPSFQSGLTTLDNNIEHLSIVPIELRAYPARLDHWEANVHRMWNKDIPSIDCPMNRRIEAFINWAFIRHVLPSSPTRQVAISFMESHGLMDEAEDFSQFVIDHLDNKLAVIKMFFDTFPELPRDSAGVEYLNLYTGSTVHPIPA